MFHNLLYKENSTKISDLKLYFYVSNMIMNNTQSTSIELVDCFTENKNVSCCPLFGFALYPFKS